MDGTLAERLARIEEQLTVIRREHPACKEELHSIGVQIAAIESSLKSAHKRIDDFKRDVCWTIGMSTTIVGIFATILTWALGGR
jgi:hypothetical protein